MFKNSSPSSRSRAGSAAVVWLAALLVAGVHCGSGGPTRSVASDESDATQEATSPETPDAQTDAAAPLESASDSADVSNQALLSCDAGGMPPAVGGTTECPSDENREGCPCTSVDASAACWTGARTNRGAGDCHDGTTACTAEGVWGACSGEVLPLSMEGGNDKAACDCFSTGIWQIANLEPCFLSTTDAAGNSTVIAFASTPGNPVTCPFDQNTGAPTVPTSWSTDTLRVDCSGQYTLCYTLKAGDAQNQAPTDCVVAQSCTTAHYAPGGATVTFPPLPGWISTSAQAACVVQFQNMGGYAALSVTGQTDECQTIGRVFQTVTYCPASCNQPNPPASCGTCTNGGGGAF